MNKKSFISYLILILLVMFVPSNVGAEDCNAAYGNACASCVYKYVDDYGNELTFKMTAKEDSKGKINLGDDWKTLPEKQNGKYTYAEVEGTADISSVTSYYSSNRKMLTCQPTLYVKSSCNIYQSVGAMNSGKMKCKTEISYKKLDGYTGVDVDSYTNSKVLKEANSSGSSSNNGDDIMTCEVDAILRDGFNVISETGDSVKLTFDVSADGLTSNETNYLVAFSGLKPEDFSDGCKTSKTLYAYCTTSTSSTSSGANSSANLSKGQCVISDTKVEYSEETSSSHIPTAGQNGGNKFIDFNTEIENSEELVGCEAVLGDMKDLINKVYKMIEIMAPILLIVFGSIDFGGAVMQNDDAALKKATNNFIKRTIATVAVFFLPLIVSLILSLPGVETGLQDVLCGIGESDETEIVKPGNNKKDDSIKEEIK